MENSKTDKIPFLQKNISTLLVVGIALAAFAAGRLSSQIAPNILGNKQDNSLQEARDAGKEIVQFASSKSDKPEVKFFVMSFCPYGNEAETSLKPIYELLKDKIDLKPQYIVDKIQFDQVCQAQVYNEKTCQGYVDQGYFPDLASCKERFYPTISACMESLNEQAFKINDSDEEGYLSLHGLNETRQDIREICAWNMVDDKQQWWNFVDNINKNCTLENIETCWEEQANSAGIGISEINDCLANEAARLLDEEIAQSSKYQVSGSPTFIINGQLYPAQEAYAENTVMQIGKKAYGPEEYRLPDTLKNAICESFEKQPKECSTQLSLDPTSTQTTEDGSCG